MRDCKGMQMSELDLVGAALMSCLLVCRQRSLRMTMASTSGRCACAQRGCSWTASRPSSGERPGSMCPSLPPCLRSTRCAAGLPCLLHAALHPFTLHALTLQDVQYPLTAMVPIAVCDRCAGIARSVHLHADVVSQL